MDVKPNADVVNVTDQTFATAVLEEVAGLAGADAAALLLLPDHEAAARLLLALPRRAAVRGPVLADDAVAVGAGADLGAAAPAPLRLSGCGSSRRPRW